MESLRTYALVTAALMVLLALTLAAAALPLGRVALVIALAIAGIKAGFIVVYFMHLREAQGVTRLFAAAGLAWLLILLGLTLADFLTRQPPPMPAARSFITSRSSSACGAPIG